MEDHYTILGLNESASEDDIKKSFRKLAMQYHPDKNPNDKSAEDKFKKINDAYSVLSDPNKRAEYDHIRRFGGHQNHFNSNGNDFHFSFGTNGFSNIDDMIRNFFHQNGFGNDPFGFNNPRRNRDMQMSLEISLEDAFTGKDLPITFNNNGQTTNVVVRIPRGIDHGTRMKFQGYGDRSIPGIPPGDLYVTIHISKHEKFDRDGPHLHMLLKIDAFEAMIGIQKEVPCIDNSTISVNIPQGSQHGTLLRIKEKGMPTRQNQSTRGDLMIAVSVTIPKDLSENHLDDLKRILSERTH